MTSSTPNPRSELISSYRNNQVADLSAGEEDVPESDVEALLERAEAFLRIGWDSSAKKCIEDLESLGIDFEALVEDCEAKHLRDVRGE